MVGQHYMSPEVTRDMTGLRYPDLLVAFNVNPAAYYRSNAHVITEQGKPPDFVLEIASPSTWWEDAGPKRESYALIGVGDYWRFRRNGALRRATGGGAAGQRGICSH